MPFKFPAAISRTLWPGQGVFFEGQQMPYMGGSSLGVCLGMSAVWIKLNPPEGGCVKAIKENINKIVEVQQNNMDSFSQPKVCILNIGNVMYETSGFRPERRLEYGVSKPASHFILDLLSSNSEAHYLIGFFFQVNGHTEGHSIAISFVSESTGKILDPNYGVGLYNSRSSLCNDLHGLLSTYVPGEGYIKELYVSVVQRYRV